jgi:hypothetical protein
VGDVAEAVRSEQQAEGVIDAHFYMDRFWENVDRKHYFWPDRNYVKAWFTDENRRFS